MTQQHVHQLCLSGARGPRLLSFSLPCSITHSPAEGRLVVSSSQILDFVNTLAVQQIDGQRDVTVEARPLGLEAQIAQVWRVDPGMGFHGDQSGKPVLEARPREDAAQRAV